MKHTICAAVLFAVTTVAAAVEMPATVLLVTSGELAGSWSDFADWKTRQGKATKVVTVEQIAEQFPGGDVQQRIRACVLEHVEKHGTRWVVLGGDSLPGGKGHVPDRDTKHRDFGYADIPTDIYYLSRKSFDANEDGVYGHWEDDRAAVEYGHPQATIGRIPVRTKADVAAYTKKVIAYESRYPTDEFAERMVYTCPERMAYPKLNTSRDTIGKAWTGGDLAQFFAHQTPWDEEAEGDYELSPGNWVKMFNDNAAGKLHMHGHGFLPVWVLEGNKTVDHRSIAELKNRHAYPVMTTVSCFTGQYDARQDPAITESMLRRPDAGAIAVIAPSREGVPVFADRRDFRKMITEGKMDGTTQLLTDFWALGLKQNLTLGEALAAAKKKMTPDAAKHHGYHWCLCELNLLGDPTLDIRSQQVKNIELVVPESIPRGQQTVVVKTSSPGAAICLWKPGEVYQVNKADERGSVEFSVETKSAGELRVTASGPSLNTRAHTIEVK